MNQNNKQQTFEEKNKIDKNLKLNVDILSSLKSLKGKVVNLQPSDFLPTKEDILKDVIAEDKLSTASSISKNISTNQFMLCDNYQQKSNTTNSILKPIPCYPNELRYKTLSYFNYGTFNPFPYPIILMPNQNLNSPYNTANSFYSINSYYYSLINPNPFLINSIITPESVTPQNNPIIQTSVINEEKIVNNNPTEKKEIYFLCKKRNAQTEINLKNNMAIENNNLINKQKQNNKFLVIREETPKKMIKKPEVKKMFSIYRKSKYVFKKRKRAKKRLLNLNKIKFICGHEGCEVDFKTKKQLIFHHYKMSNECHTDTISLIKMISSVKKLLLKENNKNKDGVKNNKILEKYSKLYKETMQNISLDEHIDLIVGFNLDD